MKSGLVEGWSRSSFVSSSTTSTSVHMAAQLQTDTIISIILIRIIINKHLKQASASVKIFITITLQAAVHAVPLLDRGVSTPDRAPPSYSPSIRSLKNFSAIFYIFLPPSPSTSSFPFGFCFHFDIFTLGTWDTFNFAWSI